MVDSNQLTTVSDLIPHTLYTIRVQAFTSVGPGPLSAPVLVKLQQGGMVVNVFKVISMRYIFITSVFALDKRTHHLTVAQ